MGKISDEVWERIYKKVAKLKAHLKKTEDPQSKSSCRLAQGNGNFSFEGLRNAEEAKFMDEELKVRKLYGDLIGTPFSIEHENQVVDIAGFSPQYNCALAWRTNENRKMDYYLVIGYLKGGKLKIKRK